MQAITISAKPRIFARIAAACVFLVSVLVLLGWTFDVKAFKSLMSGWPKVSPLTMLGFFLAALSLWCAASAKNHPHENKSQRMLQWASTILALSTALMGLCRLGDYAFGWNLNFDLLGFHETLAEHESPARMAQVTAFEFLLIGGALFFAGSSRSFGLFQVLVLACGVVAWLGFSRYLYGGEPLLPYGQMSMLSAVCFLLLSSGVFCLRTDKGLMALVMSNSAGSLLVRRLLPPAAVLTFAMGWLRLKAQDAGWFGTEAGVSLFALSNVMMFVILVWVTAVLLNRANWKQQQAETGLKHSEEGFRALANSMPQLAWIARADGHIFWYNRRWYEYTGATQEQMEGWGWQRVHDPGWLPKVMEKWKAAIESGQPFEMEFPLRGMDGKFRMFLTRIQPMKDERGQVLQWFGTNTDVEVLKQMEASLRAIQARLNSTLAAGLIGTWTWDIGNDCLISDEFTARAFSIDPEAAAKGLPASAYLQAVIEEDQPAVSAGLARAIESCGSYDLEYRVRQQNGKFLWLQARGRVEGDAAGKALSFHGAVMDVTARRLAEQTVRESEALLCIAGRAARLGGWAVELPEIRITWSDEVCAIHDMPPGTVPGLEQALGFYAPQSLGIIQQAFMACIQQGTPFDLELEIITAQGRRIWVRSIGEAQRNNAGAILRVQGAFQEITERKQAEEEIRKLNAGLEQRVIERTAQLEDVNAELRHSRAELNGIFESLPGLYLILTPDLTIVSVSDAYLKATMTTRENILGRGLFEVFPDNPDDVSATGVSNLRASLDRVRQNAVPDTMAIQKYDVRRPDGVFEEHYWSPINSPVFGADRKIKYIVHRVEDVTEFVRQKPNPAIETSAEFNARLEQMEAEVFLSSQKLQTANQKLEAANKELEAFSYSISHDLRAPLRAVDGYSHAVLEDYGPHLPADGLRLLQVIRESAQHMGNLIDDLLSFSRLSRQPLNRHNVDVSDLVHATLDQMKDQYEGRQVEFKIDELPSCEGDQALLRQVWVNLLSNALKYSRKREHAIVEIGCIEQQNQQVYFIRDNGSGFDMRYVDKLFGVFQRLHRAEDYEGTGVGLAIVQRIVHRHGGRIWAEGAVDQGAAFYFTLQEKIGP